MKISKYCRRTLAVLLCLVLLVPGVLVANAFSPRTTAPESDNAYYYDAGYNGHFSVGQCTWYAFGRVYEINGTRPKITHGNAGDWWGMNINAGYYKYGSVPALGAIACYADSTYGHVAVVEKISGGVAYVSEGNYSAHGESGHFNYGRNAFSLSSARFLGFIYACGEPTQADIDAFSGGTSGPDASPEIKFTSREEADNYSEYAITKYDATLVSTAIKNAGVTVTEVGLNLYNSNDEIIVSRSFAADVDANGTRFNLKCSARDLLGRDLTPQTTYKYSFYVKSKPVRYADDASYAASTYTSEKQSFVTNDYDRYTITFDANGGENAPASQVKVQCTDLRLTTAVPSYEGYAFCGWSESSSASHEDYKAGARFKKDSSVTLYAVWEKLIISELKIDRSKVSMAPGKSMQVNALMQPSGVIQAITWTSTNPSAASVDADGLVTAYNPGTTVIIATAGSFVQRCTVTVTDSNAELEEILLSSTELELASGEDHTLFCYAEPFDAANVDILWTSSDESVATVSNNGTVTAVSGGTCTITCMDLNTMNYAACTVKVDAGRGFSFREFLKKALHIFVVFFKAIAELISTLGA